VSAQARALAAIGTRITPSRCLQYTRGWVGIGPKYPTALAAWNHATVKHPDEFPPVGAVVPVWFDSDDPAEHVALHLGDGSVVTVNGATVTRYESIKAMCKAWGITYLGWAEDLNGVTVYTPPAVVPIPATTTTEEEDVFIWIAKGATTGQHYCINPLDGTRYWLNDDRLSNLREFSRAGGTKIVEREILDEAMESFRKLPGSEDWDGSIVGAA